MPDGALLSPGARDILRVTKGRAVCPHCGRPTKTRINPDTQLVNFPMFCGNCRRESIVTYRAPEPLSLSH